MPEAEFDRLVLRENRSGQESGEQKRDTPMNPKRLRSAFD
jgi:hypothetical protein